MKLAAAPDCVGRDDCEKGLKGVYGIDITEVVPLGYGTAQTKDAVLNGEVELGQTGTTDGTLEAQDLVLLEDDEGIQPAQNLIPAVNSDFLADNPDVEDVLNELSSTLTTEDLGTLNAQVDVERMEVSDVAQTYLEEKGLRLVRQLGGQELRGLRALGATCRRRRRRRTSSPRSRPCRPRRSRSTWWAVPRDC
ncbi:MAG: glycine betaine ABC transporter substrate-binding protein [Nocardioidaceae bacterium]